MNSVSLMYQRLQSLIEEKARIESQISTIREELKSSIPSNVSIDGVLHKVTARKDVKYAEAVRRIIDLLVADTKKPRAWTIVEQLTTHGESHSFVPAKDSRMPVRKEEVS